jgi:hypothetical protein
VEQNDLKNVAHFVINMVAMQVEGEEPKPDMNRLLAMPEKLVDL